ncbi:MAG: radical SAM protein [Pseudanabaena sp. M046S1SP1A06QC]|jgi:MoaA/NifB/PqqE/SkfB family radical SAM enzyme|nr:radical SAM protein [Pseudanabaena sp. M046S1SP1A06QC]
MLRIHDPSNLLPQSIGKPETDGLIAIPEHGIPLHIESIANFYNAIQNQQSTGKAIAFRPSLPVASKIGLPTYPILAYYCPELLLVKKQQDLTNIFSKSFWKNLAKKILLRKVTSDPSFCIDLDTVSLIEDISLAEQVYYFVDNIDAIAQIPTQVSVILGNTCNLSCVMCPYHSPTIKPTHTTDFFKGKNWMSWETMEKIANECGDDKIPVKIGNIEEPLLYPKVIDFISLCREKGVPSVHITTNGLLLDEEKSKALLMAGLTSIFVSIDAADSITYDRVRGANLNQVESNLYNFLRLREQMGIDCRVMTSFVRNHGVTEDEEKKFLEKWLKPTDGVIFYNLAEYENGNTRFTKINDFVNSFMEQASGRWACLNPWQEIYILPDNRVYYCCETVSKLAFDEIESIGDYRNQTIREIWKGKLFSHLRKDLVLNNLNNRVDCNNCGIWMGHASITEQRDGVKVTSNMITEIFQV